MARVMIFIDNSNVYKYLAKLQENTPGAWCKCYDPSYLGKKLAGNRELEKVLFYCSPPPQRLLHESPDKYAAQNQYYDAVKNQDNVELKYGKLAIHGGELFEKNLDTQLTADVIKLAASNSYDHAIIISNDGDFVSAVDGAKDQGKKVEVGLFKLNYSMDLRKSADLVRRLRPSYFKSIFDSEL